MDEIGAHVSNGGGMHNAPGRAAALDSVVFQLFTKQAQRWAEPVITEQMATAFRAAMAEHDITACTSHDSYLINLASPDAVLRARSVDSFVAELTRCDLLGIPFVVSHPGNATDGDLASGIDRNADALTQALETAPGNVMVLLETTAGTGTSLGASFEQLATIMKRAAAHESRLGVCIDTCHVWAAGYDLAHDYDDVFLRFENEIGLHKLRFLHLNDSATPFASRRDRHADIGDGSIGIDVFRRIVTDSRFMSVPKVIETPKLPDVLTADRRNLGTLRGLRRGGAGGAANGGGSEGIATENSGKKGRGRAKFS